MIVVIVVNYYLNNATKIDFGSQLEKNLGISKFM